MAVISGYVFITVVYIKHERRYLAGFQTDFFSDFFFFLNNVRVKTFQRDKVINQRKPV